MQERSDFSLAMVVSVLLHAGALVFALISWPQERALPIGGAVAINVVPNSAITDMRAAAEAQKEQTAQTEAPEPDAPPEAAPPSPQPTPKPTPAPPQPQAAAKAAPKPAPQAPTNPNAKGQKKPEAKPTGLDLDALAASLAKSKPSGGRASSAAKGPTRPETATQQRLAAGAGRGLSANAAAGLASELMRRWNPNCEVEGGRAVKVRVTFTLGLGGQIVGPVNAGGAEESSNAVVKAAADRAIRAVYKTAADNAFPRETYGNTWAPTFNAQEACS
jgi:outer membrane biosynthesis protein TonB